MSDGRLAQARAEAERRYPHHGEDIGDAYGYGHFMDGWLAADAAIEYAKPTMRPVQTMSDHMADAFHEGARWQRGALLSDEAIERAADILEALDGDDYLTVARVALTAAIGGNDE